MPEIPIQFFKEGVSFRLNHQDGLKKWILKVFHSGKVQVQSINYIFCSDRYLLKMNKEYLDHHYFTDIMTFDNSIEKNKVEADIFISIDRIAANAKEFNTTFRDELHRVMIHGALHLIGFSDKSKSEKQKMRNAEDEWLSKRNFL